MVFWLDRTLASAMILFSPWSIDFGLDQFSRVGVSRLVELRSTWTAGAAVPTWPVEAEALCCQ